MTKEPVWLQLRRMTVSLAVILTALVALFAVWWWFGHTWPWHAWPDPNDHNQRGTWGDQFGAVNSLFSGAALLGVIYAIWLQRRELQQAVHEHRNAEEQHAKTVQVQVLLHLLGEIQDPKHDEADRTLWDFRLRHRAEAPAVFEAERYVRGTEAYQVEKALQTFIAPFLKLHLLRQASIVDEDLVPVAMTREAVNSLLIVGEPLCKNDRENTYYGVFRLARAAHPAQAAALDARLAADDFDVTLFGPGPVDSSAS